MNKLKQLQAEFARVLFIRNHETCSGEEKELLDNYIENLKTEIGILLEKYSSTNVVGKDSSTNVVGKDGVYKHAKS